MHLMKKIVKQCLNQMITVQKVKILSRPWTGVRENQSMPVALTNSE